MALYAVVENATGLVVNIVVIEDIETSSAPEGYSLVLDTVGMSIGGTYIDGVYTPPPPPPLPEAPGLASPAFDWGPSLLETLGGPYGRA